MEPFFLDSGTRPDSAIPTETADRLKLIIHKDSRTVATANGPTTSSGFVLDYVKMDLRRFNGGTKMGRLKCCVIPGISSIHIGLKDITRFQLEPVVTALGQRLLDKEDVGVFEERPGYQCFPVSIEETVEQQHSLHPDPKIEAIINRFIDVFADKLDGNKANALPPLDLKLLDPTSPFPATMTARPRQHPLAWEKEISAQLRDYIICPA